LLYCEIINYIINQRYIQLIVHPMILHYLDSHSLYTKQHLLGPIHKISAVWLVYCFKM